ncbi:MAG: L,D-transpeptidase family protein, partial [Hyphomicrobiaceae bacterium]
MQIVVSLSQQKMTVYEADKAVATTRVSTGKNGHRTPAGVFSIIQKRRRHYSNIYRGAAMPYMQRLTWSGIALHQGPVPRYRASHGCIRLPGSFARSLFSFAPRRTHVVVASGNPKPFGIGHPALFQPTRSQDLNRGNSRDDGIASHQLKSGPVRVAMNSAGPQATATDAIIAPQSALATKSMTLLESLHATDANEMAVERTVTIAERSNAPLRILITPRGRTDRVKNTQRWLNQLGYDAGIADGLAGRQTIKAIKAYQSAQGMQTTGVVSDDLVAALEAEAGQTEATNAWIKVRQNGKEIYRAGVTLKDPTQPIGTHLYTLARMDANSGQATWTSLAAKISSDSPDNSAAGVLDRLDIPKHVRMQVEDLLTK